MPIAAAIETSNGSSVGVVRVRSSSARKVPLERLVLVVGAPDQPRGEREEHRVIEEESAPAVDRPAVLADHQILDPGDLALGHVLEEGRLVLELGHDLLGGRFGERLRRLVLLDVAIGELEIRTDEDLERLAAAVDDARLAGSEAEPGDDHVAQLVDGQASPLGGLGEGLDGRGADVLVLGPVAKGQGVDRGEGGVGAQQGQGLHAVLGHLAAGRVGPLLDQGVQRRHHAIVAEQSRHRQDPAVGGSRPWSLRIA